MGFVYSTRQDNLRRGLYVTYTKDWKDFYISTDFRLVLDEPGVPIDADVMQTCVKLVSFLLDGDDGEEEDTGKANTVNFGYMHHFLKSEALAWVIGLCERFLNKASLDPAMLAKLPQYDKAAEVVRTFLTEITENGKYEYEEEKA